jgi:hypothetical protein
MLVKLNFNFLVYDYLPTDFCLTDNFIISPSNIKTILDEKKVVGFGHQFINFFGHTITTENGIKV